MAPFEAGADAIDRSFSESVQTVRDFSEDLPRPARIIAASGRCIGPDGGTPDNCSISSSSN